MADLSQRLNAAIQEAELQMEITTRHAEQQRWKEHLWVLRAARDEIGRLGTFERMLTTTSAESAPRPTLALKAVNGGNNGG